MNIALKVFQLQFQVASLVCLSKLSGDEQTSMVAKMNELHEKVGV